MKPNLEFTVIDYLLAITSTLLFFGAFLFNEWLIIPTVALFWVYVTRGTTWKKQ